MPVRLDVRRVDHQLLHVRLVHDGLQQSLLHPGVAPPDEPADGPRHRVDETAVVAGDPAPLLAPAGQEGFYPGPCRVRQVVAVDGRVFFVLHGK